jgi:protein ImuA
MFIQFFISLMLSAPVTPEALHPSLWFASQLARGTTQCVETGHPGLSAQLPGGGWPTGTLTELLVQQPGIGELRLLGPVLAKVAAKRIVLLAPPHPPQALALAALGVAPSQVVWIRSDKTGDTMWAAEQVLRSGSCGALLLWQQHVRSESLRRLHLAAQHGDTLLFLFRPIAAAQDASPSPLRLSLRPAAGGLEVGFVKRRGPQRDEPLFLPMTVGPAYQPLRHRGVPSDRPVPVPTVAREGAPELVR